MHTHILKYSHTHIQTYTCTHTYTQRVHKSNYKTYSGIDFCICWEFELKALPMLGKHSNAESHLQSLMSITLWFSPSNY